MRSLSILVLALFLVADIGIPSVNAQEAAVASDPAVETEAASNGTKEDTPIETCDVPKASDSNAAPVPAEKAGDPAPKEEASETETETEAKSAPVQSGPFIDLFGENLLSLKMVDETHAQMETHLTNEALAGKKVVGVYFSADWCGPCRQFTPELVSFYDKMNNRRGKKDQFEIIWVSRCRDVKSFGQYFTHMKWLALPPEEALGQRGQVLNDLFKVKGIPHLVLLDEVGNVITYDARNKLPADRAGIGFPWRNPLATLYVTLVPKSLRMIVKSHVDGIKGKVLGMIKKK